MFKKYLFTILIICLLVAEASGSIDWKHFDFFNNNGGLNDRDSDIMISDNEATDLQNVVFSNSGSIFTRSGYNTFPASIVGATIPCLGIKFFKKADGTKYIVSVWGDHKIRKMDYAAGGDPDGTWDDITGSTTMPPGQVQNTLADFAVGEDSLIIEDGVDTTAYWKWTGSGNSVYYGNTGPAGRIVAFHKNMVFSAGDYANPSIVYYTDVGDIENWSTGLSGNESVENGDGSIVRGLTSYADALYILKDGSVWRLSGSDKDTFVLQKMLDGIGTLCQQSIKKVDGLLYWLSQKGEVIRYSGGYSADVISGKVSGSLDNIDKSRLYYCPAGNYDNDYYLSMTSSGGSSNDLVLVYDVENNAWLKFSGMNINALDIIEDSTGQDLMVFGDYNGWAFKYPYGTNDAGTAISWYYQTKQFTFPMLTTEKYLRMLRVFAAQKGNYDFTVYVKSDYESSGNAFSVNLNGVTSVFGTKVFGVDAFGGDNLIIGRIETSKGKNFIQIKFSNSDKDEPAEIKGFQAFVEESDRL